MSRTSYSRSTSFSVPLTSDLTKASRDSGRPGESVRSKLYRIWSAIFVFVFVSPRPAGGGSMSMSDRVNEGSFNSSMGSTLAREWLRGMSQGIFALTMLWFRIRFLDVLLIREFVNASPLEPNLLWDRTLRPDPGICGRGVGQGAGSSRPLRILLLCPFRVLSGSTDIAFVKGSHDRYQVYAWLCNLSW